MGDYPRISQSAIPSCQARAAILFFSSYNHVIITLSASRARLFIPKNFFL